MQANIADLDVKGGINKQQNKLKLLCLNPLNIFDNKVVAVACKKLQRRCATEICQQRNASDNSRFRSERGNKQTTISNQVFVIEPPEQDFAVLSKSA